MAGPTRGEETYVLVLSAGKHTCRDKQHVVGASGPHKLGNVATRRRDGGVGRVRCPERPRDEVCHRCGGCVGEGSVRRGGVQVQAATDVRRCVLRGW